MNTDPEAWLHAYQALDRRHRRHRAETFLVTDLPLADPASLPPHPPLPRGIEARLLESVGPTIILWWPSQGMHAAFPAKDCNKCYAPALDQLIQAASFGRSGRA